MKRRRAEFADADALAFAPSDGAPTAQPRHIQKRKRKAKGLEVVFDPEACKDYVTGFHKRKVERRKKAMREIAEKERKQRIEERAEKRAKLRAELQLERYETPPPSDGEEPEAEAEEEEGKDVRVYKDANLLTTVTTSAITLYSDDEEEEEEEGEDAGRGATKANDQPGSQKHSKQMKKPSVKGKAGKPGNGNRAKALTQRKGQKKGKQKR